ncbi:MAG: hypothetical protein ABSA93_07500 [Streptosporangiaceae bacterium]
MIVRILGEGQYRLDDSNHDKLAPLDTELGDAVEKDDDDRFQAALAGALTLVRTGTPVPADTLEPSDLILPREGASLDEVRELLGEDGIVLS